MRIGVVINEFFDRYVRFCILGIKIEKCIFLKPHCEWLGNFSQIRYVRRKRFNVVLVLRLKKSEDIFE